MILTKTNSRRKWTSPSDETWTRCSRVFFFGLETDPVTAGDILSSRLVREERIGLHEAWFVAGDVCRAFNRVTEDEHCCLHNPFHRVYMFLRADIRLRITPLNPQVARILDLRQKNTDPFSGQKTPLQTNVYTNAQMCKRYRKPCRRAKQRQDESQLIARLSTGASAVNSHVRHAIAPRNFGIADFRDNIPREEAPLQLFGEGTFPKKHDTELRIALMTADRAEKAIALLTLNAESGVRGLPVTESAVSTVILIGGFSRRHHHRQH